MTAHSLTVLNRYELHVLVFPFSLQGKEQAPKKLPRGMCDTKNSSATTTS
jgi:hypothetical protein